MPRVEVAGASIHYEDTGEAGAAGAKPPVIMVHSSGLSGAQWRGLRDLLAPRRRLLIPDLIGYGASDPWPDERPLRLADEAAIIERMSGLAGRPAHLVAHSYGGAAALHAALSLGERICSLTAYEPVAFHLFDGEGPEEAAALAEITRVADDVRALVAQDDPTGAMKLFVDYWNGAGGWNALTDDIRANLVSHATKIGQDFSAIFDDPATPADFATLATPTLLLIGEKSPRPGQLLSGQLAARLFNASLETIAGAGHMGPVTHRDLVNEHIVGHIRIVELD